MENKEKILVQFIDISKSILYDNQKLQNQALEMINACVSHEMRNPLNSIVAQNIEKKYLYIDLKNDLAQLKEEVKNNLKASLLVTNCELTLIKLNNGIKVQESSSFCLQFMIQDMLDFS
jgi:signal transduction histidine kinase